MGDRQLELLKDVLAKLGSVRQDVWVAARHQATLNGIEYAVLSAILFAATIGIGFALRFFYKNDDFDTLPLAIISGFAMFIPLAFALATATSAADGIFNPDWAAIQLILAR
jgi:hypothetical protein